MSSDNSLKDILKTKMIPKSLANQDMKDYSKVRSDLLFTLNTHVKSAGDMLTFGIPEGYLPIFVEVMSDDLVVSTYDVKQVTPTTFSAKLRDLTGDW